MLEVESFGNRMLVFIAVNYKHTESITMHRIGISVSS